MDFGRSLKYVPAADEASGARGVGTVDGAGGAAASQPSGSLTERYGALQSHLPVVEFSSDGRHRERTMRRVDIIREARGPARELQEFLVANRRDFARARVAEREQDAARAAAAGAAGAPAQAPARGDPLRMRALSMASPGDARQLSRLLGRSRSFTDCRDGGGGGGGGGAEDDDGVPVPVDRDEGEFTAADLPVIPLELSKAKLVASRIALAGTLRSRDVRKLDPRFTDSDRPAVLVRRHSIVFAIPPVKALVLHDRCYIVIPEQSSGGSAGAGGGPPSSSPMQKAEEDDDASVIELIKARLLQGSTEATRAHVGLLTLQLRTATNLVLLDRMRSQKQQLAWQAGAVSAVQSVLASLLDAPSAVARMRLSLEVHRQRALQARWQACAATLVAAATATDPAANTAGRVGVPDGIGVQPLRHAVLDTISEEPSRTEPASSDAACSEAFSSEAATARGSPPAASATPPPASEEAPGVDSQVGDGAAAPGPVGVVAASSSDELPRATSTTSTTATGIALGSAEDAETAVLDPRQVTVHLAGHVEVEEVELLLESYLQEVDAQLFTLNVVTSELAATESHVNMRMDEARNRLLRLEVWLNAFVSILAPGALVSGIFGMNLMSDLEDERGIFQTVVMAILATTVVALLLLGCCMRRLPLA